MAGTARVNLFLYIDKIDAIGSLVVNLSGGDGGEGGNGGEGRAEEVLARGTAAAVAALQVVMVLQEVMVVLAAP